MDDQFEPPFHERLTPMVELGLRPVQAADTSASSICTWSPTIATEVVVLPTVPVAGIEPAPEVRPKPLHCWEAPLVLLRA